MPRRMIVSLLLLVLLFAGSACGAPSAAQVQRTPTSAAAEVTPSCTPTPLPQPTSTPAPTATPRPAPTATPPPPPEPGAPPAPRTSGQVVLVSLWRQWLYVYQDGTLVFANAVETGMPELPTPTGTFSILTKERDITFISPWPEGSPYHYNPTHINYAMKFKEGGYYLHDAWWHVKFGPGGNVPHQLSDGRWETGSHGCVGMPIPDAQRLYNWVHIGTPVVVTDQRT